MQQPPPPAPGTFPAGTSPSTYQSALLQGPFLRFGGYDLATHQYKASVLVVIQEHEYPGGSWAAEEPTLAYMQGSGAPGASRAEFLYRYKSATFWRFDLVLTLRTVPEVLDYTITHRTAWPYQKRQSFHLPGIGQSWRWGFNSCNGFDKPEFEAEMGGIQPLWRDVMYCARTPMHLMVGGGDQLYNDGVWEVPTLKKWLSLDKDVRTELTVSEQMKEEVEAFYFTNYLKQWTEALFSDALATIPQVMIWDDHDIWDGYGSYPEKLQLSQTFQAIFTKARLYFALFQQHSTPLSVHRHNGVFGEYGWNWISPIGPNTAIVLVDSRTERSRSFIVHPASYVMIQKRIAALPPGIKHVVVLATVPVIYPTIPAAETSLSAMSGKSFGSKMLQAFMHGTGLAASVNSAFGEPELLDDLLDHWSADIHKEEKVALLHMLQDLALARGFRFTILSGDVHVAGCGRFCSNPPVHPTDAQLAKDHRFMLNVISSAIANKPPPDLVVSALNTSAAPVMVDQFTREKMLSVFQDLFGTSRLRAARNWCLVTEQPDGALQFQLRVETSVKSGTVAPTDILAPRLTVDGASDAVPTNLKPFELATRVPPEVGLALKEEAAAMVNAALVAPAAMAPAAAGGAAPLAYGEAAAAVAAVAGLRL